MDDSKKVLDHTSQISKNIVIPVSNEGDTLVLQPSRAVPIRNLSLRNVVLATIDLNREPKSRAVKVKYERANWVLASKIDSVDLTSTKRVPEFRLRVCHSVPQSAGATGHGFRAREAGSRPPPGGFAADLPLPGGG
jgi:hypothetical protein